MSDSDALLPASMSDDDSPLLEVDFGIMRQGAIYVPDPYAYDPPLPAREQRARNESEESQVQ